MRKKIRKNTVAGKIKKKKDKVADQEVVAIVDEDAEVSLGQEEDLDEESEENKNP
jgi:hypothetical protein